MPKSVIVLIVVVSVCIGPGVAGVPKDARELWADYDPRAEPLDVQVVRRWQTGGGRFELVTYRVGTFLGAKSRVAAYYGYPAGARSLPAIVHLHGGGQRANKEIVAYHVSRGYACISINWGGKVLERPKTPNTDWGKVSPGFTGPKPFSFRGMNVLPGPYSIEAGEHPKNSNWYLISRAARRAVTFLERRQEVDADRIGMSGHSMGGRLTVTSMTDARIKAAVPSVGGSGFLSYALWGLPHSARPVGGSVELYRKTISAEAHLAEARCPVLFLGATNDFNSPMDFVIAGMRLVPHENKRMTFAPHLNHRFTSETYACRPLWFDAHLKKAFTLPKTARTELVLKRPGGVPLLKVYPDTSRTVVKVDIYYGYDRDPRNRFWHDGRAKKVDDCWQAECPVMDIDEPLFAFANVTYALNKPIRLPRGYSRTTKQFALSSQYRAAYPDALEAAGVRATVKHSRTVEDFTRGFHDWYGLELRNPVHWLYSTRKPCDAMYRGPRGAKLAIELSCTRPNRLAVTLETNAWRGYAVDKKRGTYLAEAVLTGGKQRIELGLNDFKPVGRDKSPLKTWYEITELKLSPTTKAGPDGIARKDWAGPKPEFRLIEWKGGTVERWKLKLKGGRKTKAVKLSN